MIDPLSLRDGCGAHGPTSHGSGITALLFAGGGIADLVAVLAGQRSRSEPSPRAAVARGSSPAAAVKAPEEQGCKPYLRAAVGCQPELEGSQKAPASLAVTDAQLHPSFDRRSTAHDVPAGCIPGPSDRRARPRREPVAVAVQVAARHPALRRPLLPLDRVRRSRRSSPASRSSSRAATRAASSTSTSASSAGRGASASTRTAHSAPTATRPSPSPMTRPTRHGSTSTTRSSSRAGSSSSSGGCWRSRST